MEWLIAGLGNPGSKYSLTRHNIGSLALENLPLSWKKKFKGLMAISSQTVFLRPQTFMNLSGESVSPCARFFQISPSQIVVLHDDIDLPFGQLRLRKGGSDGGHNGLRSLQACLGTKGFKRIRIGIGRPEQGEVTPYVLSPFSPEQSRLLKGLFPLVEDAVTTIQEKGFDQAASLFSKRDIPCP